MNTFQNQAMEFGDTTAAAMDSKSATRSCTTCSKAKAKCVRRPGHEICERCARLRKECHSKEPVVRRRKVVKTTRAAQLEKLENKIEHLVNALSVSQAQRGYSIDAGQPSPPLSHTSERSEKSPMQRSEEIISALCPENCPEIEIEETPTSGSTASPNDCAMTSYSNSQLTSPASAPLDSPLSGVSISEAEMLLNRYQRLMATHMPFVVLPSQITVQRMYKEKPLLLHAIVLVACFHDMPRQKLMVKNFMRDVSERVLINNEKTLDILQGILVFVTWYYPHLFNEQQATNLLHLAQALTIDMAIDRPPHQCGDFKKIVKADHTLSTEARPLAMDEHRALAGTFYLFSMFASSFKKIEPMTYSKYLEEALNRLEQEKEYDSDLFLVQMVRLQHLMDETSKTEAPSAPMQMYVKAFNVDLDKLRRNDPCPDTNIFLRLQYLSAEILVWELSLIDLQENDAKPLRAHLDDLCRCVRTIKAFIDAFFTLPTSSYLAYPFSIYGQFAHAFIVLVKLASLEVEGWDMKDLHEQLNFSEIIEHAAQRYEAASRSGPDDIVINNDSFAKWAQRIRWMKQVYEAKFIQDGERPEHSREAERAVWAKPATVENQTSSATPAAQQATPPDDVLSGNFFDYLDESFWQSFAGDFELGFPDMAMT